MTRSYRIVCATAVAAVLAISCQAATKKPVKKTPAKKPTPPHYVKGTTQMAGEYAAIGTTYTLGKDCPMNITVKSMEYTVNRLIIGDRYYIPNADQKMLVLRYTLHNPQKSEQTVNWATFHFTAVAADNNNYEYVQDVGAASNQAGLNLSLKPAQKLEAYTAIMVPAKGDVGKVIVKSSDELVLRYMTSGKIKQLSPPFADPSDKSGFSALSDVPAQMNVYYPMDRWDVKLDDASYVDKAIGDLEPDEGECLLVVAGSVKNASPDEYTLNWATFTPQLLDTEGNEITWPQYLFQAGRDVGVDARPKTGQELKFRMPFRVPSGVQAKRLALSCGENGRRYVFDLSGSNPPAGAPKAQE